MSKVDVLQVADATFPHRFSFWSKWVDVAVFDHGYTGHLLQMKVSRMNGKCFRAISFKSITNLCAAGTGQVGDLTSMANHKKGQE